MAPTTPAPSSLPILKHRFPAPKLRLHLNDLAHEGTSIFLSNIKGNEDLYEQVQNVLNLLYTSESIRPGTRSVTFILRDMAGIAFTCGTPLDPDHKEIHLSVRHIAHASEEKNVRGEILGVVCHELVHCFQWVARGTCPDGLREGIADWVRLRSGLPASSWRRDANGAWDRGYQPTAYFLDYLERRFGPGTVRALNASLREDEYDEGRLFSGCCQGHGVGELWTNYAQYLKKEEEKAKADGNGGSAAPPDPVPTHGVKEC